jgi:hypothetical protein
MQPANTCVHCKVKKFVTRTMILQIPPSVSITGLRLLQNPITDRIESNADCISLQALDCNNL